MPGGPCIAGEREMDVYLHVRVLFSTILGLGVSRLLRGVARIVQHPKEYKVYGVDLIWSSIFIFVPAAFLVVGIPAAED